VKLLCGDQRIDGRARDPQVLGSRPDGQESGTSRGWALKSVNKFCQQTAWLWVARMVLSGRGWGGWRHVTPRVLALVVLSRPFESWVAGAR
jgi:hypothetical protein